MLDNFWSDRSKNNGRNSYWNFFDNKSLNREECLVSAFMRDMETRYTNISLVPQRKESIEKIKYAMTKSSPDVLEGLMRCCVLTGNFVPVELIIVGDWKNDFSYEQRFAMWRGADFKGINAYGASFINEALNKDTPIVENLWQLHSQMQVKNFPLKTVYSQSIRESLNDKARVTLWNSQQENAQKFKADVFQSAKDLKEVFKTRQPRIVSSSYRNNLQLLREDMQNY